MFKNENIFIFGSGDKGTATAIRLFKSGFRPVLVEKNNPTDLHYFRNFSDSIFLGEKTIDEITCRLYQSVSDEQEYQEQLAAGRMDRIIPLISDESFRAATSLKPDILIDCTGSHLEKIIPDWHDFPCVIRMGPDFQVGQDGHFVVGISGEELGRVYHMPKELKVRQSENAFLSTAPLEGIFICHKSIGEDVAEREEIGKLNDISILSPRSGVVTGMLHSGHFVHSKQPLFEIKPHTLKHDISKQVPVQCLAMAGGVLEAILMFLSQDRSE